MKKSTGRASSIIYLAKILKDMLERKNWTVPCVDAFTWQWCQSSWRHRP